MGALGHYLESEGIATTGISLIREHTEKMRPPRALWVTFELGRPLGVPDDPDFQRRVLLSALQLLDRTDGPILAEFAEPAPEPADYSGWACPLPAAAVQPDTGDDLSSALIREITLLAPWHDRATAERQRTTTGLLALSPADAGRFLAGLLEGSTESPVAGVSPAEALKRAAEDLKAYYLEAASAFPGAGTGHERNEWLWGETALGRTFLALRPALAGSDDPALARVATRLLVPAMQEHRLAPMK